MTRQVTWNPKSLFKTTLELITNLLVDCDYDPNVLKVTSSPTLVEDGKSVSKSDVNVNIFDALPAYFLEQIIGVIRSKGWLNINKHQDLLLAANTRKLDISRWSLSLYDENTAAMCLELAAIRCPKLTSLHMNSVKFSAEYFCKVLPLFKDLQELEVTYSAFNNCCLHTVGVYCKNLLKLNLGGCHEITDDGIEGLCGGESELGKEMSLEKNGHCESSIQELFIKGSQVTQKGIQMALRYLPHLKKFDGCYVVEALAAMHNSHQTNSILPSEYSLTNLDVCCGYSFSSPSFVPYKTRDLPLAVSLCPFVTSVYISCGKGINDSDILGLIGLKHLNRLTILASKPARESSVTFDGGLVPVLKVAGRSLKFLELGCFRFLDQSVRLDCLVEYCPNLEYLSLTYCKYSLSTGVEEVLDETMSGRANKRMKPDFAWNHLKRLSLGPRRIGENMPTESLFLALSSSPALEELFISCCATLDDELVHRVFECHSFASLKWLRLYYCNAITMRGVQLFRNLGMDWNHLIIKHCNSVKTEDGWLVDEENIDI